SNPILRTVSENERPRSFDYVSGCAMLLRASAVEKIGLLDERFFLYEEEVDYCLRARDLGYEVMLVPVRGVSHKGSGTVGPRSALKRYHLARSHVLLLRKCHRPLTAVIATYAYAVRLIATQLGLLFLNKTTV